MRIHEPIIPDWLGYTIAVPVMIAASPLIAFIAACIGLIWLKRQVLGPTKIWTRWFAWHPVRVDFCDTRWLEIVERRSFGVIQDTQYREFKPGDAGCEEPQP